MERNFKKEIQEAASNPIDMADMMAQLVQVTENECLPLLLVGLRFKNAHYGMGPKMQLFLSEAPKIGERFRRNDYGRHIDDKDETMTRSTRHPEYLTKGKWQAQSFRNEIYQFRNT